MKNFTHMSDMRFTAEPLFLLREFPRADRRLIVRSSERQRNRAGNTEGLG